MVRYEDRKRNDEDFPIKTGLSCGQHISAGQQPRYYLTCLIESVSGSRYPENSIWEESPTGRFLGNAL